MFLEAVNALSNYSFDQPELLLVVVVYFDAMMDFDFRKKALKSCWIVFCAS